MPTRDDEKFARCIHEATSYIGAWAIFFSLTVIQSPAWSQPTTETRKDAKYLSISELIDSTLSYHPLISAVQQSRIAADGEHLASKGAFDRVIKGDAVDYGAGGYSGTYYNFQIEQPFETLGSKVVGGYRQGSGTFPTYDNYYETNSDGELRLGVEVPLLRDRDTDKRRIAINKAELQQRISHLSLSQRRLELSRAAAFAYLDWMAAHAKNVVFKKLLTVAKDRSDQFSVRAKTGDLAAFDKIDNDRQVFQREAQLLGAQRMLNKAEYELAFFWRDDQGKSKAVSDFIPSALLLNPTEIASEKEPHALQQALSTRPEIERLERLRNQQELEVKLAQNDLLPKLDLQSYLARDMGTGNPNRDETELRVGLRMEVPIQTRNQDGRIQQSSANAREASLQADALKDRISVDIRDTTNAIEIAKQRLHLARKELSLTKELEEGERTKFFHGDSSLIFVNLREQATADAAVREIDVLLELNKLLVAYDTTIGRDITLR